ncbi:DUF3943 domain-containing protein [Noviherbaspirillum pedocola]|uniref:DUF3943 domain-containing protein n=1 Tax=Noviherbaspirillum pedocola TaxID=2801341 RepID=A0A934SRS6_9BURK|nr:DUF3943 domain-containing protein [Noviherbaspirillum pedocola]MBK4734392.1 DUF3943 domain-containing protein [Noviherbaspirillum pedocola]
MLAASVQVHAEDSVSLGSMLLSERALAQATERGEVLGRRAPAAQADASDTSDDQAYKAYLPAALEILGFQLLLNRIDYAFIGPASDYDVSLHSIRKNLHSSWQVDHDPFEVNQLGHPYQGSIYYGIARSNGLNFWESFGYAFAGSAIWEIAGETTPPSRNDQITTSIGGSFLGESLYRMSNLVLQNGYGLPPVWRELATAVLSPPVAFNRHFRPAKGSDIFASNDPALYARLRIGVDAVQNNTPGSSLSPKRNDVAADFRLDYGLPGKPGYQYRRPFDYFSFALRVTNVRGIESLSTRGLLLGKDFDAGERLRGIWGLYGSYDFLSPQLFQVASTGLSLGSNAQWWLSDSIALLAHASAGIGYTSTGTVRSASNEEYHYGFAPQAALSLRLIVNNRFSVDVNAREFFDGKLTIPEAGGTDRVLRGSAALTWRIHRNHALALEYITSRRKYAFPDSEAQKQREDSIGVYYTWQPADGFGAVRW